VDSLRRVIGLGPRLVPRTHHFAPEIAASFTEVTRFTSQPSFTTPVPWLNPKGASVAQDPFQDVVCCDPAIGARLPHAVDVTVHECDVGSRTVGRIVFSSETLIAVVSRVRHAVISNNRGAPRKEREETD